MLSVQIMLDGIYVIAGSASKIIGYLYQQMVGQLDTRAVVTALLWDSQRHRHRFLGLGCDTLTQVNVELEPDTSHIGLWSNHHLSGIPRSTLS